MIQKLRNRILEVAYRDGMGHIPSAFSILDIVWTLYDKLMTKDDQFILSKGHGCMALYAVLEEKGLLDWSTKAQGHPKRGGAIMASTGSLGHGLPMAIGLAMAKKIKGESGRVFCLIGDGECNEGTTWESAMLAAHQNLNNLYVLVDQNMSSERALSVGSLAHKFKEFGWLSRDPESGHIKKGNGHLALWVFMNHFDPYPTPDKRPNCITFNTIKGKGVPFMENNPEWHNRKLTKEEYEQAIRL